MVKLIYDGDCDFCQACVNRVKKRTLGRVEYIPYQLCYKNYPQLQIEDFQRAVKMDVGESKLMSGAEAIFKVLEFGNLGGLYWMYKYLPGFSLITELGYRFVAKHRNWFSWMIR